MRLAAVAQINDAGLRQILLLENRAQELNLVLQIIQCAELQRVPVVKVYLNVERLADVHADNLVHHVIPLKQIEQSHHRRDLFAGILGHDLAGRQLGDLDALDQHRVSDLALQHLFQHLSVLIDIVQPVARQTHGHQRNALGDRNLQRIRQMPLELDGVQIRVGVA